MKYKKFNMRGADGKTSIIELAELPTISDFLTVRDGRVYEGDKLFKAWAINVDAYAIPSPVDKIKEFANNIAANGVNLVRLHHTALAKDAAAYVPTFEEAEAQVGKVQTFIDILNERGIRVWLTGIERRRFTEDQALALDVQAEIQGNRPAGIWRNEVAGLFFISPDVGKRCKEEILKLVERHKNNPGVAGISFWNECTGTRTKGYYVAGERGVKTHPYALLWFKKWDEFNTFGSKQSKPDGAKFGAWLGYKYAKEVADAVDAAGWKALTNVSQIYGDVPLCALIEQLPGKVVDLHIYHETDQQVDPLSPDTDKSKFRTFESVVASMHLPGKPIMCSEWASVYQANGTVNKKMTKSPSWLTSPSNLARSASNQDVFAMMQYAAHSYGIGTPRTAMNGDAYDSFVDPEFVKAFYAAMPEFERDVKPAYTVQNLTEFELFGDPKNPGPTFKVNQPGVEPWALKAAQYGVCNYVNLPTNVQGLPFL